MGKKSLPIATVSFLSAAAHAGIVATRGYRRGVSNTFSRSTRPTVLSGTTIGGTNMARKRIVVVGTSFAGYTGALELHELLGDDHDITVVANTHDFVFIPSLIWYPFGLREKQDISFDVRPIYAQHHIHFVEASVTGFDLERRLVKTNGADIPYDYLLIATGPKVDFDSVRGLGPHKHSHSICNLAHAEETRRAWKHFLHDPGPIVVGAAQGAACFGAA